MSSREFKADVMLNGIAYLGMSTGPETVAEWFDAWEKAREQKNFRELFNLIHWGLQTLLYRESSQESVVRLFWHYLAVADGHQSARNFGHYGSVNQEIDFSRMSHGERMQKLSDKAWMELCNRVFVLGCNGYGSQLKYSLHFRHPNLATAFIRFIDPDRWCDGQFYLTDRENVDTRSESAYHVKACHFVRQFLQEAWLYREIVEREKKFAEDPESPEYILPDLDEEEYVESLRNLNFFRKLKPKLVKLMVHYGMIDFLHDRKLDHPTRRVLRDLAFGNTLLRTPVPDCEKKDLAHAYGQLDPKHGYPSGIGHRVAAQILLLYPYLVKGRKDYIRQKVQTNLAAKAAKAEQLRAELEAVAAKLQAL